MFHVLDNSDMVYGIKLLGGGLLLFYINLCIALYIRKLVKKKKGKGKGKKPKNKIEDDKDDEANEDIFSGTSDITIQLDK